MKKLLAVLLSVCLMVGAFCLTGCTPREEVLKVYNWGEYMSRETQEGFESWYKEKTGKNIKVKYSEFETNEEAYIAIATQKSDYDVFCPSDYMVERMKNESLLKEFNEETKQVVKQKIDPRILELSAEAFDENNSYAMPYLWGTIGIMYNVKNSVGQNDEVVSSWDALWNETFSKKIYMKDSVRDAYSVALLYHYRDQLKELSKDFTDYSNEEYQKLLQSIFYEVTDESIAIAKEVLIEQKKLVKNYEVDQAKDDMIADKDGKNGLLGMFWSCDAGYVMNGDDGDTNKNLRYIVPNEGSNVWVDCWVIPKYAANESAANLFIQYLCETEVGYDCMDYAGSTTAVKAAADEYKADIEADEDGFFNGAPEGFREMYMEMMFPTDEVMARCAIMKDFGEFNDKLNTMWEDVMLAA